MISRSAPVSGHQFAIFRILFGLYLFVHLASTLQSVSGNGLALHIAALVSSLLVLLGVLRPIAIAVIWFALSAPQVEDKLFIPGGSFPLLAWLLVLCALVPVGEPLRVGRPKHDWRMPLAIYAGAWAISALFIAGHGAIQLFFVNPLSPIAMLELLFAPLAFAKRTRPLGWIAMLAVFTFRALMGHPTAAGDVMMMLFLIDPRWIPARKAKGTPVLFFDGVCGLCNASVDFVLAEELEPVMKFSPLQSDYAFEKLPAGLTQNLSTLIVLDEENVFTKSDAVLRVASYMGGIWRFAQILAIVPRPIRNSAYDLIARHRYQWFGKKDACRLPTPKERLRFLMS